MGVVQVGPWVPTPSPWTWNSPTCGVLALPPGGFASIGSYPSASLGQRDRLVAAS